MSTTNSGIQWTDRTWNPTRGCSRVSKGCEHCYAERQAYRFHGEGQPYEGLVQLTNGHPQWTGKVKLVENALLEPLKWRRPQRVFVNSMSDLFHEALSDDDIDRVFAVMALCPHLTFQILTKRVERMQEYFSDYCAKDRIRTFQWGIIEDRVDPLNRRSDDLRATALDPDEDWPLPNCWLGVSVEDRARKSRIELLRQTPAALRFLSIEPLLEDIGTLDLTGIGWAIIGGESGHDARPLNIAWVPPVIAQCRDAGVACFVKQLGSKPMLCGESYNPHGVYKNDFSGRPAGLYDRKGGSPMEWPEDLRVREFPV